MGYWPDGTNTGVPDGVVLDVRTGDIHVTKPGTVLSNLDIRGTVHIEADNVTIENCRIVSSSYWSIYIHDGATGSLVQDCTIDGQGRTGKGILGQGTFLRNDISNVVDGIDVTGSNTRIEGNYIHDLYGTDGPHYDGINIDASNVTVRHNTVINDHNQTSALMVSSDWGVDRNVLVEDNLLVGGGYTIYAVTGDAGPGSLVDVQFINNHFGSGAYGTTNINTAIAMRGNVNDGASLAAGLSENGAYVPGDSSSPPTPVPPTAPRPSNNASDGADVLTGDASGNTIDGRGGNDRIDGGAGNDTLRGGAGDDALFGGTGNDTLNGGSGKDTLTGGAGSDIFAFSSASDTGAASASRDVITDFTSGEDKIDLAAIDADIRTAADDAFTFIATKGAAFSNRAGELIWSQDIASNKTVVQGDVNGDGVRDFSIELTGLKNLTASDFTGVTSPVTQPPTSPLPTSSVKLGTYRSDRLDGTNSDDVLDGLGGNDRLNGGNGNDTLIGGTGRDILTGGSGRDVFQFKAVSEMGTYANARDIITDFTPGQDRIDLSKIDADSRVSGDQAFTFLAGDDTIFTKRPGEVAWHTEGDRTIVQGDINGDGRHDFEIQLSGHIDLTQGDFIL